MNNTTKMLLPLVVVSVAISAFTGIAAAPTKTVEPFAYERRAALWTDAWG